MAPSNRYEAVRYLGRAYEFTHPDRLATTARLRGLATPDVRAARVLEIGCGDGINLLGMACSLPQSDFTGVDLCAEPLVATCEAASALGVTNLSLEATDLASLVERGEQFDYIVAHGVLSWVPDETKHALLAAIGNTLSADGVALVSFNSLPGWRFRGIARDVILASFNGVPRFEQLPEAREIVHTFARELAGVGLYGAVMKELTEYVDGFTDSSLFHDLLSPDSDALQFREFAALYQPAGLQYLGDAVWADNVSNGYPPAFRKLLAGVAGDPVAREQLIDMMRNSLFRRSLLCRAGRKVQWDPRPQDVRPLFVTLRAKLEAEEKTGDRYRLSEEFAVTVTDPTLRRGMKRLVEQSPRCLNLEAFGEGPGLDWGTLAPLVLQTLAAGLIELLPRDRPHSAVPGAHPESYPLARWQSARGVQEVINCRQEQIILGPIDHIMLKVCDGRHARSEIVDALLDLADAGEFNILVDDQPVTDPALRREAIDRRLDDRLVQLRLSGLLAV